MGFQHQEKQICGFILVLHNHTISIDLTFARPYIHKEVPRAGILNQSMCRRVLRGEV